MKKLYKNKEFLIQKYVDEKLSMNEVAKICGCGTTTIHTFLIKYNIPRRTKSEAHKGKKRPYMTGKNNPAWNGGKRRINGYIYIFSKDHPFRSKRGYVAQHRLIVEESLRKQCPNHPALIEIDGVKYLRKDWIPHHRDNIRDNNVWSNLSVMSDPSHVRFHHLGRKHSEETKRKMTLSQQLQSSTSENNPLISEWGF